MPFFISRSLYKALKSVRSKCYFMLSPLGDGVVSSQSLIQVEIQPSFNTSSVLASLQSYIVGAELWFTWHYKPEKVSKMSYIYLLPRLHSNFPRKVYKSGTSITVHVYFPSVLSSWLCNLPLTNPKTFEPKKKNPNKTFCNNWNHFQHKTTLKYTVEWQTSHTTHWCLYIVRPKYLLRRDSSSSSKADQRLFFKKFCDVLLFIFIDNSVLETTKKISVWASVTWMKRVKCEYCCRIRGQHNC